MVFGKFKQPRNNGGDDTAARALAEVAALRQELADLGKDLGNTKAVLLETREVAERTLASLDETEANLREHQLTFLGRLNRWWRGDSGEA